MTETKEDTNAAWEQRMAASEALGEDRQRAQEEWVATWQAGHTFTPNENGIGGVWFPKPDWRWPVSESIVQRH